MSAVASRSEVIELTAYKLARSTNGRDAVLWAVAAVVAVATVIPGGEIVWLFLAVASFGAVYYGGGWRAPSGVVGILPLATVNGFAGMGTASLGSMAWYFVKAGALTFGSGLTIVPFLHPPLGRRASLAG